MMRVAFHRIKLARYKSISRIVESFLPRDISLSGYRRVAYNTRESSIKISSDDKNWWPWYSRGFHDSP